MNLEIDFDEKSILTENIEYLTNTLEVLTTTTTITTTIHTFIIVTR